MDPNDLYMHRCLELARLGAGRVAPNPMVGAVLVHEGRIIGEGYHQEYGQAHAEVNCLASVKPQDMERVPEATLYVSLEPCAHFGKTPPCADLIIRHKIPKVVVCCRDPFSAVNGKGIEKLMAAGIEVVMKVMEEEGRRLNKRFFRFHEQHRPYVILKWAQTLDGKMAGDGNERLLISNEYTNRLVHRWRSEESSILIGTHTALADDPELTTRLWPGKTPLRLVVDRDLSLPASLKLFTTPAPTLVFNLHRHTLPGEGVSAPAKGVGYYQVTEDVSLVHQMMNALYRMNLLSVLVEGGNYLLQSFINEGMWDEARIITNEELSAGVGLPSPVLKDFECTQTETVFSDTIRTYKNTAVTS